jgi:hypothetical protein
MPSDRTRRANHQNKAHQKNPNLTFVDFWRGPAADETERGDKRGNLLTIDWGGFLPASADASRDTSPTMRNPYR